MCTFFFFFSPPSFFLKYYDGNFIRNEDALRALISSVFFFFFFNRKKRTRRETSVEKQIAIGRNRIRGISDRGRRRISYPRGGAKSEATEKRKRTFSPSLFLAVISIDLGRKREREREEETELRSGPSIESPRGGEGIHGPNIGTPYLLLESTFAHRTNPVGENKNKTRWTNEDV